MADGPSTGADVNAIAKGGCAATLKAARNDRGVSSAQALA